MYGAEKTRRIAALWILVSIVSVAGARAGQTTWPSPWVSRDIGSPLIAGDADYVAPAGFTIKAAGTDIWGASDQFHFVYVAVPGDAEIRARVDSITNASSWSKAGVMIRSSLTAGAAHAYATVSYSKGLAFQRRTVSGGQSLNTAGELAGAPRWVRLVRAGTRVTAYSSANGVNWTTIGSETIQLSSTAYFGIAVTSHNALAATTAAVSEISLALPSSLPAGQSNADIGAPLQRGSATYSAGAYTIVAGGADIWGSSDQFHYVYQQASGDIDVKVRVASITRADLWSKAGVMIRQSLDADSAHGSALASSGKGYAFQRRATDGGLSIGTSGSTAAPPGWVRLKRSGDLLTAYQSADGVNWTVIGSDPIVMADPVYVGIAATSHNTLAATTVKVDNFSIVQTAPAPPPPANKPPVVTMTTNGTVFTAPASVALSASASDPEGKMARVEFYAGTTLLGTDSTAPYAFTWSNVAAGTYAVRAVAYDTAGASGTSATVNITVNGTTSTAPTSVVFTAAANHATAVTSYLLEVFASGANPATATPIASSNLGKPAPATNGDITVNRATFFSALARGTYVATVSSVGTAGTSRGAPITFTR